MYCVKKVTEDLTWVGANDRRLSMFEGVYSVPNGVSYNSYLLLDEKTVLFDTVDKSVSEQFMENVEHVLSGRRLDYVVIQHMEPDHSATLAELLRRCPETTVVCNKMIADMIKQFFNLDITPRALIVKEGDTLSTGRHNLTFIAAPMVHWPEVMVTYDTVDKILFSADAFGTFGALNGAIFADEVDFDRDYMDEARRYYTNIVGKYGAQVQALLKKHPESKSLSSARCTVLSGAGISTVLLTNTCFGAATRPKKAALLLLTLPYTATPQMRPKCFPRIFLTAASARSFTMFPSLPHPT